MSKQINVNPGQYKVAGRARQGEDVVHERQKKRLREVEVSEQVRAARDDARRRRTAETDEANED
jgi:hypothetical protein